MRFAGWGRVVLSVGLVLAGSAGCSVGRRVYNLAGGSFGLPRLSVSSTRAALVKDLSKLVDFVKVRSTKRDASEQQVLLANQRVMESRRQFTDVELAVAQEEDAQIAVPVGETADHHLVMLADPETGEVDDDDVYEIPKGEIDKMDTLSRVQGQSTPEQPSPSPDRPRTGEPVPTSEEPVEADRSEVATTEVTPADGRPEARFGKLGRKKVICKLS